MSAFVHHVQSATSELESNWNMIQDDEWKWGSTWAQCHSQTFEYLCKCFIRRAGMLKWGNDSQTRCKISKLRVKEEIKSMSHFIFLWKDPFETPASLILGISPLPWFSALFSELKRKMCIRTGIPGVLLRVSYLRYRHSNCCEKPLGHLLSKEETTTHMLLPHWLIVHFDDLSTSFNSRDCLFITWAKS